MKALIKKIVNKKALAYYHKTMALLAKGLYRNPSQDMIVIGVTGTNGKSSTVALIAKILEQAGYKVGSTSTVSFKIAGQEWLNDKKMTMLGRFGLQKILSQMKKAGCSHAVIETSSQGIDQFRHLGINYDIAVFTNLTPEHIEAHGGFVNYQKAKEKLFAKLREETHKTYRGSEVPKAIIANGDDEHVNDFMQYWADEKYIFGIDSQYFDQVKGDIKEMRASDVVHLPASTNFKVNGLEFKIKMFGRFNVYNCLAAVTVARALGINLEVCRKALEKVSGVPGRMEFIDAGQGFKVLIDYAPEPESVKQLYKTIEDHQIAGGAKIIHVLGSCGGGRDVARRPILGDLVGKKADYVVVTNEDPYDDNPQQIIDQVADGAIKAGKKIDQNLFKILDRREAIRFALKLAKNNDLVVLTGKGSEQAICLTNGAMMKWDERQVVREELANCG